MRLLAAVFAATAVLFLVVGEVEAVHDGGYLPMKHYPRGGVGGGDAIVLPLGDIQGLRNIQGGRHTGVSSDLNLDIGAGSTEHPGDLVLNFDVGRRVLIYDGRKRKVAAFSSRGIVFYRRPVVRRR